ncbi:hypothetical protein B4U80_10018, partial [Leptotrombidium deliense]
SEQEFLSFPMLKPFKGSQDVTEESAIYELRQQLIIQHNLKIPSVTQVLNDTMSAADRQKLEIWKRKMIEELGVEGFENLQKKNFARGHGFHKCVASTLRGEKDVPVSKNVEALWESVRPVLSNVCDVSFLESRVQHPFLWYRGIVDCVAYYENEIVVIDWKTAAKKKTSITDLYDNPIQAVAYAGALNFDSNYQKLQISSALIVVAYEDGSPADVHKLSPKLCDRFWELWLKRNLTYWSKPESQKTEKKKETKRRPV